MTRAKKHVCFLVNQEYPSKFIKEFSQLKQSIALNCPWCDNGRLEERINPIQNITFYACNNSHYCNFTRSITPNDIKTLANACFEKKDFVNTIHYFERFLATAHGSFDDYYKLGLAYKNVEKYDKALQSLTKAISIKPKDADAYFFRAVTYFYLLKYEDCITEAKMSFELKPDSHRVNVLLAETYFRMNDFYKALYYIEIALVSNPKSKKALKIKNELDSGEKAIESTDRKMIERCIQFAIDLNLKIKFNYYKSPDFDQGIRSMRTILPQGFVTLGKHESLCVYGHCYMRKAERKFNVDRISELVINPNKIEYWIEEI